MITNRLCQKPGQHRAVGCFVNCCYWWAISIGLSSKLRCRQQGLTDIAAHCCTFCSLHRVACLSSLSLSWLLIIYWINQFNKQLTSYNIWILQSRVCSSSGTYPPAGRYLEGQENRQLCSKEVDIEPGQDGQGGQSKGETGIRKRVEAEGDKVFWEGVFILVCNCKLRGLCLFYAFRIIITKTKFKVTAFLMQQSLNISSWVTA